MKIFSLCMCGWLLVVSNLFAAPNNLNIFFESAAKFENIIISHMNQNEMPLLEDENVAILVSRLIDKNYIDIEQYEVSELNTLLDVCDKVTLYVKTYVNFNARILFQERIKNNPSTTYQDILNINVEKFQGVLKVFQPFQLRCIAAEIPLLEKFLKSLKPEEITPTRLNGIKIARKGILQVYTGLLTGIGNNKLEESYRLELLKAVSESSYAFSRFIKVSDRELVIEQVNKNLRHISKKFEKGLGVILHFMSMKECINLCKL